MDRKQKFNGKDTTKKHGKIFLNGSKDVVNKIGSEVKGIINEEKETIDSLIEGIKKVESPDIKG